MKHRYIQIVHFEQETIVQDGIAKHLKYDFFDGGIHWEDFYFNELIERCFQADDIFTDLWRRL